VDWCATVHVAPEAKVKSASVGQPWFHALDAESGKELWSTKLDGALGGGVISYLVGSQQRIAVVSGTNSPIWPVPKATAKIVVFGLK
jgi:outer membrane protein assembly factor BamB